MRINTVLRRAMNGDINIGVLGSVSSMDVETRSAGRVIQCFLNTDLRNGHDGLSVIAKGSGINVTALQPGQYVVFINTAKNKLKIYTANNVVAFFRATSGQPIDLNTIRLIPLAFRSNGHLDYDRALKQVIEQALYRRPVGNA